jgi:hypothetical protein
MDRVLAKRKLELAFDTHDAKYIVQTAANIMESANAEKLVFNGFLFTRRRSGEVYMRVDKPRGTRKQSVTARRNK